ncbi:hypothetical protein F4804DRAFT_332837 [Jackrogersella minutella]|nr:hypothetical protein F4804DRAFT_332837 [Jackrogersella minutella]
MSSQTRCNDIFTNEKRELERITWGACATAFNPVKIIMYDEDKGDGTPCFTIVFDSVGVVYLYKDLTRIKHSIESRRQRLGLDKFRIDAMDHAYPKSRFCLLEPIRSGQRSQGQDAGWEEIGAGELEGWDEQQGGNTGPWVLLPPSQ